MSSAPSPRPVRRASLLALAALGFIVPASAAPASVLTGPVANPANGHSYYLLSQDVWTASEAQAVALGGHLATIDNAAENSFVYASFSHFGNVNRNLWIGLYDADQAVNSANRATRRGEFVWASGAPVAYTAWSPVEPNNPVSTDPASPEFYGHVWNPTDAYAGTWNNFYDRSAEFGVGLFGVVEVVPEPPAAGAALVAAGAVTGLRRRRR